MDEQEFFNKIKELQKKVMIKATEAKTISRSAVLDPHILDQINFAIIKEASKGNYAAWIGSILPPTNVDKYYNYLKELGFEISFRYKGEHGVYVIWG